jgi:hypothetical protein
MIDFEKVEFDPLFPAGFHTVSIDQLEILFVNPFPDCERRKTLVEKFRLFLDTLSEFHLRLEIWIDGSFATKKLEPDDIDIVIFYDDQEIRNLDEEEQKRFLLIIDHQLAKINYLLDIYLADKKNNYLIDYWTNWYGKARNQQLKGIPRLTYG